MPKRRKMSRKASKRSFTKGAKSINRKNVLSGVMRGGIRM